MAFLEQRISTAILRGSRGGPRQRRMKTYVASGRMKQDFDWVRPLQGYDISYGIKTQAHFEEVRALFYLVMFTPYEGFRVRDWNDYQCTQANSTLTFVSGTTWQMCRKYTHVAASYLRPVFKIVGAPTIYRTRSAVVTVASATVDVNTGVATISGHVGGDTYTWVGEYDVPVTFADETLDQIELDGNWNAVLQNLPSIKLEEIRL
jgi:uncharacterized protein (TIGR02217 family)